MHAALSHFPGRISRQKGVSTLFVTLVLLAIVTVVVLFSTNLAFFEQKTTTNENRSELTQQAAEYALSLSGEFLKANRNLVISNTGGGWLTPGAAKWVRCPAGALASEGGPVAMTHPCAAERIQARREQMYYFDNVPATGAIDGVPYTSIAGALSSGVLTGADASTRFPATTTVNALLCRINTDLTQASPSFPCSAVPTAGNSIAVTLVSETTLTGEGAAAVVKETWATTPVPFPGTTVPLIASGLVEGLGNATIVAAPNNGFQASIWAPSNVDIETGAGCGSGGSGIGSVTTCNMGGYLGHDSPGRTPIARENLKTTCANSNSCGCPSLQAAGHQVGEAALSGHSGPVRLERADVLDMDCNAGGADITFFPKEPYDDPADATDDSLFEYIFNVGYVVAEGGNQVLSNCGSSGTQNCAAFALLEEYGATQLADCSSLGPSSSGIYYVTGDCDVGSIGSPTASVVLVVDGDVSVNGNANFYGMLFARSNDNTASVAGSGNVKIFGSMIVEGDVDLHGNIDIVYDNTAAGSSCTTCLPPNAKFGKVSGSWLDSRVGI